MKKILYFTPLLLFGITILQIVSCNKIDLDYFLQHPGKVPKLCNIKQILSYRDINVNPLIANFSYNKRGDPVTVIYNHVGTGQPDLFFFYDNNHRLTDYVGAYRHNDGCTPGI